jgi:putative ABC transport system permease protein
MRRQPLTPLRRLLAWLLPSGPVRDGLLGDLDELYAERVGRGRVSADVWYGRQVVSAAVHYTLRRGSARRSGDVRRGLLDAVRQDARGALRMVRERPGLTVVIVLTLALGIGANTAVFSVVRSVLLRPLPFEEDERLAVLLMRAPRFDFVDMQSSPPEYAAYREHARSFEKLAAYQARAATVTADGGEPERVDVVASTWDLFETLGVPPLLGRGFVATDAGRLLDPGVAIVSHGFWTSRYGADRGIVGRTVLLDGVARTIVGVMPADFRFPDADVRFWLPLAFSPEDLQSRGNHSYSILVRLHPDATLASAESELSGLVARFVADPTFNFHDWHPVYLRPLRAELVGDVSRTLWLLLGAVGLVLLIACANVAGLLLVRAEERTREMSVRTALGAGRGRLVSQLLTESVVLAAMGGAAGVAVAYVGVVALRALAPPDLPRVAEIGVDAAVLAFTLCTTVAAGILFGLAPALRAGRADLQGMLRAEGRGGTAGRRRVRLRQLLVVSETALAVVLLVIAGLLLQSFRRLMAVDPGYRTEHVLTASLTISETRYPDGPAVVGFYESLLARIAALPGVHAAGAALRAPLDGTPGATDTEIEGWVNPGDAPRPITNMQAITPGYFQALGIPIVAGRDFEVRDAVGAPLVAIVSESLARTYWPGRSPLGGRVRRDWGAQRFAEVIGVVPDVRQEGLDQPAVRGTVYFAHAQTPLTWEGLLESMTLIVRADGEAASIASAIRSELRGLDPSVPLYGVRSLQQAVADATATQRFSLLLQLLFAAIALALAAVGLYGVLAHTVARRTTELGIRMALGARAVDVLRMVLRQGMAIVIVAILVGVAASLAAARVVASLLFGVSSADPVTYAAVVGVLVLVGLLACWIPARRATRVDPAAALRSG